MHLGRDIVVRRHVDHSQQIHPRRFRIEINKDHAVEHTASRERDRFIVDKDIRRVFLFIEPVGDLFRLAVKIDVVGEHRAFFPVPVDPVLDRQGGKIRRIRRRRRFRRQFRFRFRRRFRRRFRFHSGLRFILLRCRRLLRFDRDRLRLFSAFRRDLRRFAFRARRAEQHHKAHKKHSYLFHRPLRPFRRSRPLFQYITSGSRMQTVHCVPF